MVKTIIIKLVLLLAVLTWSQSDAHLETNSFPEAMSCVATPEMIQEYIDRYRGDITYNVRTTPPDPTTGSHPITDPQEYYAPLIDGLLEDSIWYYAETLLINSWEDAGTEAACDDNPLFYGPQDLHAIWRFCYNHDGLYVGVEVHDDIHDVDSLSGWWAQDGIEMGIDPWDWGHKAAGLWEEGEDDFRRYMDNFINVIPYDDNAHLCYLHILKRMNEEPYLTGLIGNTHLYNYRRGDEATNFTLDKLKMKNGMEFAVQYQGVDRWFREIHHVELKLPFHTELWVALDDAGGYFDESGLPMTGTLFKVEPKNNDDDVLGPNGRYGNLTQSSRIYRGDPFGIDPVLYHWSETRQYMTMKYNGSALVEVVHPNTGDPSHGHKLISGVWVDEPTEIERYNFTGGGTIVLDDVNLFYDSIGTDSGRIADASDNEIATYKLIETGNLLKDTLILYKISETFRLIRYLATGWDDIEGRWVQAERSIVHDNRCGTDDTIWVPRSNAKEFRYCPLTSIDTTMVPGYARCSDSLRIFDYATQVHEASFTYTHKAVLLGRDSTHLFHDIPPRASMTKQRIIVVTYKSDGSQDTLVEIPTWNTMTLGKSGNLANKKFKWYGKDTSSVFDYIYVWDKYSNQIQGFYHLTFQDFGNSHNRTHLQIYRDIILNVDVTQPIFWMKLHDIEITIDSLELVNYDSTTKTADDLVAKADTAVFDENDWVQQTVTWVVTTGAESDTFVKTDTTQVIWWDPNYKRPSDLFNTINPWCISVEHAVEASVKTLEVGSNPNPFNPTTNFSIVIPPLKQDVHYGLKIYNVRGQLVRTLIKGKVGRLGLNKKVHWHGLDNTGRQLSSSVYYFCLTAGEKVKRGPVVMVK